MEEQYRRAGITFTGIALAAEPDERVRKIAEEAAAQNGYDNFGETHNRLATMFHLGMKSGELTKLLSLYAYCGGAETAGEFYKNKYEAERLVRKAVNRAYD